MKHLAVWSKQLTCGIFLPGRIQDGLDTKLMMIKGKLVVQDDFQEGTVNA
jgi:hypothetical protein